MHPAEYFDIPAKNNSKLLICYLNVILTYKE